MISIWNINNNSLKSQLNHTAAVTCLALWKDNLLASGSIDNKIKIWNIETNQLINTLTGHTDDVTSLVVLDENRLASSSNDKTIRVYIIDLTLFFKLILKLILFDFNYLKIWNLNNNETTILKHSGSVTCLAVSVEHKYLAGGLKNGEIKLWDMDDWEAKKTLRNSFLTSVSSLIALPGKR